MLLVNMLRVVALESQGLHASHLSIHIAVFAKVLPDTRPAGIASEVDGGAERPGHADGTCLVSGGLGNLEGYIAVERCTDIDVLREQRTTLSVGGTVVLVQSEDTGDANVLHGQFLDVADDLLPLLGGRCTGVGRIQDGANLVLAEQRVSLGTVNVEHAMCIVGLARDEDRRAYYVMKNSWGTRQPHDGLVYMPVRHALRNVAAVYMTREAYEGR